MSRGRFVTLEGGEGAGKSTQLAFVKGWLEGRGRRVLTTREPGGSKLAEAIRGLVLQDWPETMDPQTELLLMFAGRAAHLRATVVPALDTGTDVVCDRFVDSSYAYQGAGKGVPEAQIRALEAMVVGARAPDLTLVLDLPPELGLARTARRGEQNRFEAEPLAFMQRVRAAFLARAAAEPQRCEVIDASQSLAGVQAQIERVLSERL
ncbi:MAG TPA: dTMP kinase [Solimonas sp.]|nr:dTMP kinase [Solimonas sp.]